MHTSTARRVILSLVCIMFLAVGLLSGVEISSLVNNHNQTPAVSIIAASTAPPTQTNPHQEAQSLPSDFCLSGDTLSKWLSVFNSRDYVALRPRPLADGFADAGILCRASIIVPKDAAQWAYVPTGATALLSVGGKAYYYSPLNSSVLDPAWVKVSGMIKVDFLREDSVALVCKLAAHYSEAVEGFTC